METILRTRTKAPFVIVHTGDATPAIVGYAYTERAAVKRARKIGRKALVLPVAAGKVTVPAPEPAPEPAYHLCTACRTTRIYHTGTVCGPCQGRPPYLGEYQQS